MKWLNETVKKKKLQHDLNYQRGIDWIMLQIRIEPDVNENLQWIMEDHVEVKFILKMVLPSLIW